MNGPIVSFSDIEKSYGAVRALHGVTAELQQGEFFSLLGPSGCGKTTLLRIIAGLEEPGAGELYIDGQRMHGVPANKRPTNMVFQSYAVFPHMNVEENVAYGLRSRRMDAKEISVRVGEALMMVGLEGFEKRPSHAMSGGQRQRVALARALVLHPKVLLLDEPLSALDRKLRGQMRLELVRLQRAVGITFVLVTHDQEEAVTMSDRIAVMFRGNIEQIASPQELYRRPVNREVAGFIGEMNFLRAQVLGEAAQGYDVDLAGFGRVEVPREQVPVAVSGATTAAIRPELLTILFEDDASADRETTGSVDEAVYYGELTYYRVRVDGVDEPLTVSARNAVGRPQLAPGSRLRLGWSADSLVLLN